MKTGFFIYILSGKSRTLYTGMTKNLERRTGQHRGGEGAAFAAKYHLHRLLYYETYPTALDAIRREKTIKGWTRRKKLALIRRMNPTFSDLGEHDEKGSAALSRHPERSEGSPTDRLAGAQKTVGGRRSFVALRPPQDDAGHPSPVENHQDAGERTPRHPDAAVAAEGSATLTAFACRSTAEQPAAFKANYAGFIRPHPARE